jgi:hypothetical protein
MKLTTYVGLDSASIGGVAFYDPTEHKAVVAEIRGDPLNQLVQLNGLIKAVVPKMRQNDLVFVFELLVHFRNAVTVRSLLERHGFIKWNLKSVGYKVQEVDPNVVRKFLETGTKQKTFDFFFDFFDGCNLTNNHTDAIACAMYQAHLEKYEPNWKKFRVERIEL